MKKAQGEIDPLVKLKIFGPAISTSALNWEVPSLESDGRHAIEFFLQECRKFESNENENPEAFRILDVLSFHLSPSFRESNAKLLHQDFSFILESTQNWWNEEYINRYDHSLVLGTSARVIPRFKTWIEKNYPGTELAVTEFDIKSEQTQDYDPVIKIIYLADLYGIMATKGVDYAAQKQLNSYDQNVALIDEADNITALYYPFSLFANNFKSFVLNAQSSLAQKLNVYACQDDTTIVAIIINKEAVSHLTQVSIDPKEKDKDLLNFDCLFPGYSITCIKIPLDQTQKNIECWQYGSDQIKSIVENLSEPDSS